MRVLMLGWEFPPFISGGLGTACYGLTRALSRQKTKVTFVLPKMIDGEFDSAHVKLLSPQSPDAAVGARTPQAVASTYQIEPDPDSEPAPAAAETTGPPAGDPGDFENVTFKAVPARFKSAYQSAGGEIHDIDAITGTGLEGASLAGELVQLQQQRAAKKKAATHDYAGDLLAETQRYADLSLDLAKGEKFDVIHAHDWLTYPAGMAVARATGKPLVVHVHSTEFDRAGENIQTKIFDIERRGMQAAVKVICVSFLTAKIVEHRYGIDPSKIEVIYNGIDNAKDPESDNAPRTLIRSGDKIVLYLGRITMQKGPEYFIYAAKKVLEKVSDVKFVMAGAGDMTNEVMRLAVQEGLGNKVIFTGFLRGKDVERVFKIADLYVMPSVSEPFGIAPLEAISHDVPVIISKQSGVSEVLSHALKVDFWDVDDIADKIIAVLRHPPLSATLRKHADMELRNLTWDGAAARCEDVYRDAINAMRG